MRQYKSKSSFKKRVQFDKPIIQKNLKDFDDSDVDLDLSFDESNNSDIEIENSQTKCNFFTI